MSELVKEYSHINRSRSVCNRDRSMSPTSHNAHREITPHTTAISRSLPAHKSFLGDSHDSGRTEPALPEHMEMFDSSHLSGKTTQKIASSVPNSPLHGYSSSPASPPTLSTSGGALKFQSSLFLDAPKLTFHPLMSPGNTTRLPGVSCVSLDDTHQTSPDVNLCGDHMQTAATSRSHSPNRDTLQTLVQGESIPSSSSEIPSAHSTSTSKPRANHKLPSLSKSHSAPEACSRYENGAKLAPSIGPESVRSESAPSMAEEIESYHPLFSPKTYNTDDTVPSISEEVESIHPLFSPGFTAFGSADFDAPFDNELYSQSSYSAHSSLTSSPSSFATPKPRLSRGISVFEAPGMTNESEIDTAAEVVKSIRESGRCLTVNKSLARDENGRAIRLPYEIHGANDSDDEREDNHGPEMSSNARSKSRSIWKPISSVPLNPSMFRTRSAPHKRSKSATSKPSHHKPSHRKRNSRSGWFAKLSRGNKSTDNVASRRASGRLPRGGGGISSPSTRDSMLGGGGSTRSSISSNGSTTAFGSRISPRVQSMSTALPPRIAEEKGHQRSVSSYHQHARGGGHRRHYRGGARSPAYNGAGGTTTSGASSRSMNTHPSSLPPLPAENMHSRSRPPLPGEFAVKGATKGQTDSGELDGKVVRTTMDILRMGSQPRASADNEKSSDEIATKANDSSSATVGSSPGAEVTSVEKAAEVAVLRSADNVSKVADVLGIDKTLDSSASELVSTEIPAESESANVSTVNVDIGAPCHTELNGIDSITIEVAPAAPLLEQTALEKVKVVVSKHAETNTCDAEVSVAPPAQIVSPGVTIHVDRELGATPSSELPSTASQDTPPTPSKFEANGEGENHSSSPLITPPSTTTTTSVREHRFVTSKLSTSLPSSPTHASLAAANGGGHLRVIPRRRRLTDFAAGGNTRAGGGGNGRSRALTASGTEIRAELDDLVKQMRVARTRSVFQRTSAV